MASLLVVVPFPFALRAGRAARMTGVDDFVERSRPLVAAIRSYEVQHGEPPATLDDLVPEFLPAVPETGIGQSPTYKYLHGENAQSRFRERWVLRVGCSSGFLNWDEIVYFASGDYPTRVGSDPLQKIGDWAYRHE